MGSFAGHILPGMFFMGIATWWFFITAYRYIKTSIVYRLNNKNIENIERNKKYVYKGSVTMPCTCCPCKSVRRLPLESLIKFAALFTHICGEIYYARDPDPESEDKHLVLSAESAQHIIMYSGFLFSSIIEILFYYGVPFPKRTVYMINIISLVILQSVILLHSHDRDMLDGHLHWLFGIAVVLLTIAVACELYNPNNHWATFGRAYFFFIMGLWLFEIGFVIWPHTTNPLFVWNHSDHRHLAIITASFGLNLAIAAIYFLIVYLVVYKLYNCIDRFYGRNYDIDIENDDYLNRYHYDYEKVNYSKFIRYETISMNDFDETEKLADNQEV